MYANMVAFGIYGAIEFEFELTILEFFINYVFECLSIFSIRENER